MSQSGELSMEGLVRDHLDLLYRFAYRLTQSSADAEDAVHETFLIAAEKFEQIRSPEFARAWLIQILRHQLARQQRQRIPTSTIDIHDIETAQLAPGPFDEMVPPGRVLELLDAMPAEFREPLLLFYFEDLRYREIAEALAVPLGTVMSRIARGKAYLRDRLVPAATTLPAGRQQ